MRQVRHDNVEITKETPQGCADLGESSKWSAGGQLLQIGQQRFVEVWDDRCDLYTLLKLKCGLADDVASADGFRRLGAVH